MLELIVIVGLPPMVEIIVIKGDITKMDVDAIVNPANSLLIMGGGVAGAIKRRGGQIIEDEAVKQGPIPVGNAVITSAGNLKARYVIHAPTMERPAMSTTIEKVKKAILAALKMADEKGLESLAFPGMGTGVGGLSSKEGADAFREAITEYMKKKGFRNLKKIYLVAFTEDLFKEFERIKQEIANNKREH